MLDPSFLTRSKLNHCGYSHIKVFNDLVQQLKGNSPDTLSNVILERINSSRIASIDSVFWVIPTENNPEWIGVENV